MQKDDVRQQLKVLLLHLAAQSDHPSTDLHELLCEVVEELYQEAEDALREHQKRPLRMVSPSRVRPTRN